MSVVTDPHGATRATPRGQRQLLLAFSLTLGMMVVELVVGWLSNSLALLADAGHMLTDASALALSFMAAWFSTSRPATSEKTFGYYRSEILAALANGLALWVVVLWLYVHAIQRLWNPVTVPSTPIIGVAVVGLLVNLLSGRLLKEGRSESLNLQGAWLNVMSDALGSLGVIVAGLCIRWYGISAADPIASMVIGVLIAINAWRLVAQAVNVLLEGTPGHLRTPEIVQAMRAVPGVQEVHDVHLWTITTGMHSMSGHVVVGDVAQSAAVLSGLNALVSERFGITHTTFQLEPTSHRCQLDGSLPTAVPRGRVGA